MSVHVVQPKRNSKNRVSVKGIRRCPLFYPWKSEDITCLRTNLRTKTDEVSEAPFFKGFRAC